MKEIRFFFKKEKVRKNKKCIQIAHLHQGSFLLFLTRAPKEFFFPPKKSNVC